MNYPRRVMLGVDQLLNTLLGGYPDETLSSRCYRQGYMAKKPHWYVLYQILNWLIFWQKNHCQSAYMNEIKGVQNATDFKKR